MTVRRTIHIVDDEEAIRKSVSFMLKASGYAVVTYSSGAAFLRDVGYAEPGCALLDVRMPEMDGIEVQRALGERGISMPVIILTGQGDMSITVRAMQDGAIEVVEKPFEKAVILDAITAAFDTFYDARRRIVRIAKAAATIATLKAQERDVLDKLVEGLPNKMIAGMLGISERIVEMHRANLISKLHARDMSDVLRIAFTAKLDGTNDGVVSHGSQRLRRLESCARRTAALCITD